MDKGKAQVSDKQEITHPDPRPCFCKFMFPINLFDLRIPPDFRKRYLINEETNRATLKTHLGTWNVKLMLDGGDIYLKDGWPEFVKYHFLGDNIEYLLFKYNGQMSFDVVIFDKNGCSRNLQSLVSSFTSTFPYFECSIKDFNTGSKCYMLIPADFSRKHLNLSKPKTFVLRNSKGVSWTVNIVRDANNRHLISKGWKAFADANLLKKDDVCIFELVENDLMLVHIFI